MRNKIFAFALSLAVLGGLFAAGFTMFRDVPESSAAGADPTLIVALRGTSDAVEKTLANYGDGHLALDALCFPGLDLVDVATGKVIGTAEDCLADVIDGEHGGLVLTGTTFFNFQDHGSNGSQLVSRGRTTVQAINEPAADFTHITGAIPALGSNQVLDGTRRFAGAEGTVRLSGAVNMTSFAGPGTPITFDCLFEINLRDQ